MALVGKLGDDRWSVGSVGSAACCHVTLVFFIMHLFNICRRFSHNLSIPFTYTFVSGNTYRSNG